MWLTKSPPENLQQKEPRSSLGSEGSPVGLPEVLAGMDAGETQKGPHDQEGWRTPRWGDLEDPGAEKMVE